MQASSEHKPAIQALNIGKQVSSGETSLTILDNLDVEVAAGESLAIVGSSGSGKSTLLGLLAGLDEVSSGEIRLLGQSLAGMDEDDRAALRAGRVGFVFQSFQLLSGLTAVENVMLSLELSGQPDARRRASQALESVGLAHRLTHRPRQLSGGEQQRVALARAFAIRPQLLFADEPTGNLDDKTSDSISDLLFQMNRETGTTLVMVTHDRELAGHCDRCLTLSSGRLA